MDFKVNAKGKYGGSNRKDGKGNRDRKNKGKNTEYIYTSKHIRISHGKIEKSNSNSKSNSKSK